MKGWKNDNDPWLPLKDNNGRNIPSGSSNTSGFELPTPTLLESDWADGEEKKDSKTAVRFNKPPSDPLHNMIDSDRYIQSLEKKLERLKKKKENPSSKEIIDSLALFHEDQMRNYVNSDSSILHGDTIDSDRSLTPSYMKRKLFPELQAISATEVAGLIKEDFVEKSFEELSLNTSANSESGNIKNKDAEISIDAESDTGGEK